MLTLSLLLVLVFHSKGSTVNWSLIRSDMPSVLGLVLNVTVLFFSHDLFGIFGIPNNFLTFSV